MTLTQIRYFIAAAETESVLRAAQEMRISPSAITSAIQALEHETHAILFLRQAKGMRLTHQGHQMLLHARRILAAVADAKRAVKAEPDAASGDLNVGVTRMVSGYYLADLLARYQRVFPAVQVRVVEDDRPYLEHLLVNGEIDVGLFIVSNLHDQRALDAEILVRSPWRVWLPANHALVGSRALELSELEGEPLIMLTLDELAETTTRHWEMAGLAPHIVLRTSSVEAVRSLVGMGSGVATLPDMAYRPWSLEGDRVEACELAVPPPTVDVGVAWRRGTPVRPSAAQFLELCREFTPARARGLPAAKRLFSRNRPNSPE